MGATNEQRAKNAQQLRDLADRIDAGEKVNYVFIYINDDRTVLSKGLSGLENVANIVHGLNKVTTSVTEEFIDKSFIIAAKLKDELDLPEDVFK